MAQSAQSRRKWIFIRGLARHSAHWGPFIPEFQKAFPQDEIETLDLRGNGHYAHSPSFLSIVENVRDLRSRSRFIQNGEHVFLMTISLGSMVAAEWARLYPDEIEGLVTINTSDKGTASFFERMKPANYLHVLKFLGKDKDKESLESEIMDITTNHFSEKHQWAQKFSKIPPTSKLNLVRQLVAAGTYEFPDHKPKTEVLILCSEKDKLCSVECSKRIAEMWTVKPHTHPTAGHDIPLDDPAWVVDQVKNWLQEC